VATDGRSENDCTLAAGCQEFRSINSQFYPSSSLLDGIVRGRSHRNQENQVSTAAWVIIYERHFVFLQVVVVAVCKKYSTWLFWTLVLTHSCSLIFFSCIQGFEILENRVSAWKSLSLGYLVLESHSIFLSCNTVICGYSYCWNSEHLVTGISLNCGLVKSNVNVVKMPGDCWFNDNWTLSWWVCTLVHSDKRRTPGEIFILTN